MQVWLHGFKNSGELMCSETNTDSTISLDLTEIPQP